MRKGMAGLSCALLCVLAVPVFASTITLTPPTGNVLAAGAGGTRGDIITMTGTLDVTSIGIDALIANGAQMTFSAYIYDDVGGSGVNPLALGSSIVFTGDGTEQWYDLPISYILQSGQNYDIGIDFHSFNDSNLDVNFYFFDSGSNSPFAVGPVTVIDGEESHCGSCNIYAPNLRLNATEADVPEPGTLVLMSTGLIALLGAIRRKRL